MNEIISLKSTFCNYPRELYDNSSASIFIKGKKENRSFKIVDNFVVITDLIYSEFKFL